MVCHDRAFGSDPAYWVASSPFHRLERGGAPLLAVCSTRRVVSCAQAERFAVKAGRFLSVDPEDALNATCEKFIARFRRVEEACAARGAEMSSLPLDELTRLWNEAKYPTE